MSSLRKLHNLDFTPVTRMSDSKMRSTGHVACMGAMRKAYKVLSRKT